MALTMLAFGAVILLIVHSSTLAQTTRSSGRPITTTKARTSGPTRTTRSRTTGSPITPRAARTLSTTATTTTTSTSTSTSTTIRTDSTPTTTTTWTSNPFTTTTILSSGSMLTDTATTSNITPTSTTTTTTTTSVCSVNATTLDAVPGQVGHVTSPNYPSPYYNNADCRWLIYAGSGYVVKVTVLNFSLETGFDFLELYNGIEPSSSSLIIRTSSTPQQSVIHSSGQYMYIRFYSDGSVTYSGFRLTYEAVDQQSVPTSVCTSNGTNLSAVPGQVGYLLSLYWPSVYSGFISCSWTINSTSGYVVRSSILNVTNPEFSFYIRIYDGMSESSPPLGQFSSMPSQTVYYSSGQSMYITLTTYGLSPNSLFNLTYEAVDQLSAPTSVCTSNGTAFSAVPGQVGYLSSLYYPSVYSGFISCSWRINSISGYIVKATILNVTNPQFYFYIGIYDGMSASSPSLASIYSMPSQTVYYSSGQSMYITLTTYGLSPNSLFNLTYEAVDQLSAPTSVCTSSGTNFSAVPGQVGYLTSLYYPSLYSGFIYCSWTVNSPNGYVVKATVLNVTNYDLYFYITIYDGMSASSPSLASISSMPSHTVYYSSGQSMYITLTTYGLSPNSLFNLTYEAVDQLSAPTSVCTSNGTTFSAVPGQVGYLPSLYYPSVYSGVISCSWPINTTYGYVVKATVLNVTNSEFYFYITIYDGVSASSPSLAWISSMPSQTAYYSSGQSMYITLTTYGLSPNSTFSFTYEAVDQLSTPTSVCTSSGTNFSAVPGQVGYLTSLYYPSLYSGFISCSWTVNSNIGYVVKATVLNVTNYDLYFYITIYDGMSASSPSLGQFSSMPSQTVYYSSGQSMYITLTTYGLSPNSLFNLTYEAVDQLSAPASVCTSNGTTFSAVPGQVGYLPSLYYPSVYSGFISCSWPINTTYGYVVKATVLNVTNSQFYFYISIYDGVSASSPSLAWISSMPSQTVYYSSGQSMYITLTTSGLSPNSTFSLTYEAVDQLSAPTSVCTSNGTTFSAVPGQVGYLPSLYYPSVYSGSITCSWTIISSNGYIVKATILNVTNPQFYFYIVIYDGMSASSPSLASIYSVSSPTVYYSSGQSMYIRITTYGLSPNSIFFLTYEAVDQLSAGPSVCSVNAPTIYAVPGQVGYLTSPNYPSPYYNNADCRWLIVAGDGSVVRITVLNFNLEPGWDYLELYNGSQISSSSLIIRTSSTPQQSVIYSTGQYMYIRFSSDSIISYTGFRLTYEAVDQQTVSTSDVCPVNGTALSALSGQVDYLRFPNHPSSDSNNTGCRWLINSTIGDVVKLTVLSASSDFFYYIQIFDGISESSPTLVTFYGMPLQTVYYSSGQYMYIRYTGYGSVNNSGLRVTYEAVNQQSVPTWGSTTTSTVPRASDPYTCRCSCVSTCSPP
ncbi:cubilin-like isoform X2 [Pomacea canaliculata]|uniref:cubilin-like isoform X2 n=1 Tax=Pomacea canaliculata TaxID=400727 RepID=UPI000D727413|nr:cubilin-like isoform X2 [Pomacea canaliculata]